MALNPDAVGTTSEPARRSWTARDSMLYALGVGAGLDDLAFTTDNTKGVPQQVLPTMGVVLGFGGAGAWDAVGTFDWTMLLHGEQAVEVHAPIPPAGEVESVTTVAGMYDKGSAAVVVMESESKDTTTGELLFTQRMASFIRGAGGWGGDRGPSGPRNVAPERAPDRTVSYDTRADQALIYRLSGDYNPLHSDPSFAAAAGFERPILHGLCTYGFTGRALLEGLCGGDPARFRSMEARFSSSVYPGDTLDVAMWETGDGEAVFQTRRNGDTVVIDSGLCRYAG